MTKKTVKKILCTILSVFLVTITPISALAEEFSYDFSDEAQQRFDEEEQQKKESEKKDILYIKSDPKIKQTTKKEAKESISPQEPMELKIEKTKTLEGKIITIPSGENIQAVLQSSISSGSLSENDTIAAVLSEDWIYKGVVIAPVGSILYGKATDIQQAGHLYKNGQLAISFEELLTPEGDKISFSTNKVYIKVESKRTLKTLMSTIGGAAIGVLFGALYGVATGDVLSGLTVGAAMGAGGGIVNAATQTGEEAQIPSGTIINVKLTNPMQVVPYK